MDGTEPQHKPPRRPSRLAAFVHRHRVALPLLLALVLVILPARNAGVAHYRLLSGDWNVPVVCWIAAVALLAFLLGFFCGRAARYRGDS